MNAARTKLNKLLCVTATTRKTSDTDFGGWQISHSRKLFALNINNAVYIWL